MCHYQESYESSGCDEPNEVFLHARAFLYKGDSSLDGTTRFPSSGVWRLDENETKTFSPPLVISQPASREAPASPLLYIAISVWEFDGSDEQRDLFGNFSDTIFLADFVLGGFDDVSGEQLVRRQRFDRSALVKGFAGSDAHCSLIATGFSGNQGQARINYTVEVTWLKDFER